MDTNISAQMEILDFGTVSAVLMMWLLLSLIIFVRYVIVSGLFSLIFYKKPMTAIKNIRFPERRQEWVEMRRSAVISMIFAATAVLMIWMYQEGYTKIYTEYSAYAWYWGPLSIFIYMSVQEVHYYFLHRWMHMPKVYKLIHKAHHDSISTSPWTSFSFSPAEGVLQAMIMPLLVMVVPIHWIALAILLLLMTVSAAVNHLGVSLPAFVTRHKLATLLIGPDHHSAHHRKFLGNYGLYFTLLDRWFGTEVRE